MIAGCDETLRYVDAWVDGELDPSAALIVETHMRQCSSCQQEAEMLRTLKKALGGLRECTPAPVMLRARLAAALDAEDRDVQQNDALEKKRKHARGFVVAGAALAGLVLATRHSAPQQYTHASLGTAPPVLADIAGWHSRELPPEVHADHPDQVTNFFRGKMNVPVRPVAFRGLSAQRMGARIANVRHQMAAELYYDFSGRRISLFVFGSDLLPRGNQTGVVQYMATPNQPVYVGNANGYTVAFFERGGVGYAVASDLPPSETVKIIAQAEIQ